MFSWLNIIWHQTRLNASHTQESACCFYTMKLEMLLRLKIHWYLTSYIEIWAVILKCEHLYWDLTSYIEMWASILKSDQLYWNVSIYTEIWAVILKCEQLFDRRMNWYLIVLSSRRSQNWSVLFGIIRPTDIQIGTIRALSLRVVRYI